MLSTLMGLTTFLLFFFFSETFSNFVLAKVRPVSAKLTFHQGIEEVYTEKDILVFVLLLSK